MCIANGHPITIQEASPTTVPLVVRPSRGEAPSQGAKRFAMNAATIESDTAPTRTTGGYTYYLASGDHPRIEFDGRDPADLEPSSTRPRCGMHEPGRCEEPRAGDSPPKHSPLYHHSRPARNLRRRRQNRFCANHVHQHLNRKTKREPAISPCADPQQDWAARPRPPRRSRPRSGRLGGARTRTPTDSARLLVPRLARTTAE